MYGKELEFPEKMFKKENELEVNEEKEQEEQPESPKISKENAKISDFLKNLILFRPFLLLKINHLFADFNLKNKKFGRKNEWFRYYTKIKAKFFFQK